MLQGKRKKVIDLSGLQALCAVNYRRLLKVMPEALLGRSLLEESSLSEIPPTSINSNSVNNPADALDSAHLNWGVGEQADRLLIKVTQRCRYTTMLELQQPQKQAFWLPDIVMQLRLYHDARLAEVTGYQNVRNIKTCYEWPNPKMLQPDEKVQQNQLLAEWLELCLQHGWLSEPVPRIK